MDERRKIDCVSAADRDTLVMILARNGYAVRQAKEKRGTSKSYDATAKAGKKTTVIRMEE